MESGNTKALVYAMIVVAVVLFLAVGVVRFGRAARSADIDHRTPAQRLQGLENSPGVTTPQAKNFIRSEKARQDATKAAEDDVLR